MAFIPAPNVVKVTLSFVWAGQIVEITLSFRKNTAPTTTEINDLIQSVRTWWSTHMRAWVSNHISLTNINATDQSSDSAPSIDWPISPTEAGSVNVASVPTNSALVLSFRTPQRGRSYRGRVYIPGLPNSSLASATSITGAVVTAWSTVAAAIGSIGSAEGWEHVVVSRYANNAPRVVAESTDVTNYIVEFNLDSQRRRLAGRGI